MGFRLAEYALFWFCGDVETKLGMSELSALQYTREVKKRTTTKEVVSENDSFDFDDQTTTLSDRLLLEVFTTFCCETRAMEDMRRMNWT